MDYGWILAQLSPALSETEIKEVVITHEVDALDNAQVVTQKRFTVGAYVTLYHYADEILFGKVTACDRVSLNQYRVEFVERAVEVRSILMQTAGGSRIVEITNPSHTLRITDYVTTILYGSEWTDGTGDTAIVDPIRSLPLPDMRFSNTYVMTGLEKFIKLTLGYMIWFDYSLKKVYYGDFRLDLSGSPVVATDVNLKQRDTFQAVTEVIILGKSPSIYGRAIKVGATPPYKTLQYQYTDYADVAELESIAYQVLSDKENATLDRYEVEVTTAAYLANTYRAGDKVNVVWAVDGVNFTGVIKDIKVGMDAALLGVGDKEITVYDLLDEKLVLISGFSEVGSTIAYDGGWQNVGNLATAKWRMTIDDVSALGSFNLHVLLDKWKKFIDVDPQVTGLTGANSASTAIAGANTHATGQTVTDHNTGITSTGNKATGITGASNALTGVSINNLNPVGSFYNDYRTGSGSLLSAYMWNDVASYLYGSSMPDGTWLGLAFLTLTIDDTNGGSSDSGYNAKLMEYIGGSWYQVSGYVYAYGPRNNSPYTITFAALFLGDTYTYGNTYKWQVYPVQGNCTVRGYGAYISLMPRHNHATTDPQHPHSITDPQHNNPITDITHPHSTSDPTHTHTITDPTHPHNITDKNHTHNENDNLTLVNTYPSIVEIRVNGTLVKADPGGSLMTLDCGDVLPYLVNGLNEISVDSATAGCTFVMAEYVIYGDLS